MKTVRIEFEVSDKVAKIIQDDDDKFVHTVREEWGDRWHRWIAPGDMALDTYDNIHNPRIEVIDYEELKEGG